MEEQKTILLVEDNQQDVELVRAAFEKAAPECRLSVARSGREALDYLQDCSMPTRESEMQCPAVILLDLKLVGMDGLDLLRRLKSNPALQRIPVVILSSSMEPRDLAACYDAGANSYLVKPVSFQGLNKLAELVNNYWIQQNQLPPAKVNYRSGEN